MGSLEFFPSFFFLFTFLPKNLPQNKGKIPIFCSSSIWRLNSSNFKFFSQNIILQYISLMTTAFRKNETPHVFCFCFCLFVCLFCFALFAFCLFVCFYFFWGGGYYTLQISSLLHKSKFMPVYLHEIRCI